MDFKSLILSFLPKWIAKLSEEFSYTVFYLKNAANCKVSRF
jgi:hypothetical protein